MAADSPPLLVVTGAFGYSGKRIARQALDRGYRVATLTNSPNRPNPFGEAIGIHPLSFDDKERLTASLAGARVLINTYWVRFNHADFSYRKAVANTKTLFEAARAAGVSRVVHVSITNPSKDSPYPYFRGKSELEEALKETGLSYAILRPAVLFGDEDILVNNLAWTLRHFPFYGMFGDGSYRIQPIHVNDLAELALREAGESESRTIDAIGPETFTFRELVEAIGRIIGRPRRMVPLPPRIAWLAGRFIGFFKGDVTITWDEVGGLMDGLLATDSPPQGTVRLTDWARAHAAKLGVNYASELARRLDRATSYAGFKPEA